MNQIRSGIIISYINIAFNILFSILLTPVMMRGFGDSQYGLYLMIGSFISFIAVADFGINDAIVRFIARYRARGNREGERDFFSTCIGLYLIISLIVVAAGAVCYVFLPEIIGKEFTPDEIVLARRMFAVLLVNLLVTLPGSAFNGLLTSYELFSFQKSVLLARLVLRTATVYILVRAGFDALAVVIADTLFNVAVIAINAAYAKRKTHIKVSLGYFRRRFVPSIFRYSFWIFCNMLFDQFYWRVGQIILGVMFGGAVVTVFANGIQLGGYYFMVFSTAIAGVFLPRAAQMSTQRATGAEYTAMMTKIGRLQFAMLMYIVTGFVLLGRPFITQWIGAEYMETWTIALIVMIPMVIPLTQNFGISILKALNMHRIRALVFLAISIVNVIIGWLLARRYGGIGMAAGTALSLIVGQTFFMNWYYKTRLGIDVKRFFMSLASMLPGVAIALAAGFALSLAYTPDSWLSLAAGAAIYTAIYFPAMYFTGFDEYEKGLVRQLAGKLKTKS